MPAPLCQGNARVGRSVRWHEYLDPTWEAHVIYMSAIMKLRSEGRAAIT